MTRHIAFEGIENFRDFGDYAAGGRRLKRGLLYRSAHHAAATDADLERMAGLGVSVLIDLRRTSEREREPSRRWAGCAARVIESDTAKGEPGDWLTFVAGGDLSPAACHRYMVDFYSAFPFAARYRELYASYFQALADTDGAVVVHCAAGKDRTGIICALTQHLAGVHDDDLVEDYLLTNRSIRLDQRLPKIKASLEHHLGQSLDEDGLRIMLSVAPEYLETGLTAIRAQYGSIEGYLERALGVTAEQRERIHDRLLA